jgi:hypothetical protein
MESEVDPIRAAFKQGKTLAVADQILIAPVPGNLIDRLENLLKALFKSGAPQMQICQTLIQLGMNLAGRDAQIVGYGADEIEVALNRMLSVIDDLKGENATAMVQVVNDFLSDMKSVNLSDSLSGLMAERIEPGLDHGNPGRSFLELLKQHMRSGVYWRMVEGNYAKFGNDFARGLEYLRHYGFCQVSTNPVLAARAFDEDPRLTDALKAEIDQHDDWKQNPEAHADEMAMAATLIALWPNLAIFRPLALYTELKDYMVSFQLNPNIADQADASVEDARSAHKLATEFLKKYDRLLGLGNRAGRTDPNIVFKVGGGHEAARKITQMLNTEAIGTNNTVVYTVAQEVRLILDAFDGKARAVKKNLGVVRTYETNMGGRFVSHLREVEAEKLFVAAAAGAGQEEAQALLDELARSLDVTESIGQDSTNVAIDEKARVICAYKYLKSLDHPLVMTAAALSGRTPEDILQLEDDLQKAGTLVARRVYWLFYAPENRPKWIDYLSQAYDLAKNQAEWILESMDVLPASKRIPEDTLHALGKVGMCHTEFPNHQRAVQLTAEKDGFKLQDYEESVLDSYDPEVALRLRALPDFCRGYDLTPPLKDFLIKEVGIDAGSWQTQGIQPAEWPDFGSVQKTSAEFKSAYDRFAQKCVETALSLRRS